MKDPKHGCAEDENLHAQEETKTEQQEETVNTAEEVKETELEKEPA